MKKADKQKLAEKIHAELKALNLPATLQGNWVMLDPKVPMKLVIDAASCGDELAELVKGEAK